MAAGNNLDLKGANRSSSVAAVAGLRVGERSRCQSVRFRLLTVRVCGWSGYSLSMCAGFFVFVFLFVCFGVGFCVVSVVLRFVMGLVGFFKCRRPHRVKNNNKTTHQNHKAEHVHPRYCAPFSPV